MGGTPPACSSTMPWLQRRQQQGRQEKEAAWQWERERGPQQQVQVLEQAQAGQPRQRGWRGWRVVLGPWGWGGWRGRQPENWEGLGPGVVHCRRRQQERQRACQPLLSRRRQRQQHCCQPRHRRRPQEAAREQRRSRHSRPRCPWPPQSRACHPCRRRRRQRQPQWPRLQARRPACAPPLPRTGWLASRCVQRPPCLLVCESLALLPTPRSPPLIQGICPQPTSTTHRSPPLMQGICAHPTTQPVNTQPSMPSMSHPCPQHAPTPQVDLYTSEAVLFEAVVDAIQACDPGGRALSGARHVSGSKWAGCREWDGWGAYSGGAYTRCGAAATQPPASRAACLPADGWPPPAPPSPPPHPSGACRPALGVRGAAGLAGLPGGQGGAAGPPGPPSPPLPPPAPPVGRGRQGYRHGRGGGGGGGRRRRRRCCCLGAAAAGAAVAAAGGARRRKGRRGAPWPWVKPCRAVRVEHGSGAGGGGPGGAQRLAADEGRWVGGACGGEREASSSAQAFSRALLLCPCSLGCLECSRCSTLWLVRRARGLCTCHGSWHPLLPHLPPTSTLCTPAPSLHHHPMHTCGRARPRPSPAHPPAAAAIAAELKLSMYSLQSCAAAVLALRVPHIPQRQMAAWFRGGPAGGRWRCLEHLVVQVGGGGGRYNLRRAEAQQWVWEVVLQQAGTRRSGPPPPHSG